MRLLACTLTLATGLAWSATVAAATQPVTAWYMYGSSGSDLKSYAYAHGCHFAQAQPGTGMRVLLLDFGAARKLDSSTWGAVDFSNTRFSNADILSALERAADGYHNCHARGSVDIAYGNSNYHLSGSGMSSTDAWWAGFHQSERSEDLADYQSSKGYTSQTSDAASDMEPSWESPSVTKQLVSGDQAQGWALYYDFGSADGCPQSGNADGACNNGWHVSDVGYVSYAALALPLPEIYYTANADHADGRRPSRPPVRPHPGGGELGPGPSKTKAGTRFQVPARDLARARKVAAIVRQREPASTRRGQPSEGVSLP